MEMTCVGLKDDMALIESDLFLYENDTFLFESEVFLVKLKRLGACFGHVGINGMYPFSNGVLTFEGNVFPCVDECSNQKVAFLFVNNINIRS